jgi:23S rRNA (guanine2445-N2)-methyltransferase / 23S rRNA (guanine2069-N7)-methyltransferase
MEFFATTARGMAPLLAAELRRLGAASVGERRAGAAFSGSLETAYRACLWSRIANRVLLPLAVVPARTADELYAGVRTIRWIDHLGAEETLAVDFASSESALAHTRFGALKTKDAIVDQLRDQTGARPSIDVSRPDVRVNVYVHRDRAVISIDLSGESQHRRGYRERRTAAPLKENLAAAVLSLADWPRLACDRAPLLDPMCGSGTIPIEAALMAADIAPGLGREYFGFLGWRGHQPHLWKRLLREAEERRVRDRRRLPDIRGCDADARSIRVSLENIDRAGVRGLVHVEKRELAACRPSDAPAAGVLVTNPPYGERLGDAGALAPLYQRLGDVMRRHFTGWTGYVLTGNTALGRRIGLRAARRHVLFNGAIECRLLVFPISTEPVRKGSRPRWQLEQARRKE